MSDPQPESQDPIMEEVRRNRNALSMQFGGDVRRLIEHLNEQAARSGRKVIQFPPRRP